MFQVIHLLIFLVCIYLLFNLINNLLRYSLNNLFQYLFISFNQPFFLSFCLSIFLSIFLFSFFLPLHYISTYMLFSLYLSLSFSHFSEFVNQNTATHYHSSIFNDELVTRHCIIFPCSIRLSFLSANKCAQCATLKKERVTKIVWLPNCVVIVTVAHSIGLCRLGK